MIVLYSNGDRIIPCTWLSAGRKPVDVSGASIVAQVKRRIGDVVPVVELTTSNGLIEITDAAAGKFQMTFPAALTAGVLGSAPKVIDLLLDVVATRPGAGPANLGRTTVNLYRGVTTHG